MSLAENKNVLSDILGYMLLIYIFHFSTFEHLH